MKKKIYQTPRTEVIIMGCLLLQADSIPVDPGQSGSQTGAEAPGYQDEWDEEEESF